MDAVLAVIPNNQSEILFIRRPGELKAGTSASGRPGQFCLPGGKIKANESAESAAVREVFEEVGLKVVPVK